MNTAWRWCSPAAGISGIDLDFLGAALAAIALRMEATYRRLNRSYRDSEAQHEKFSSIGSGGREHALAWSWRKSPRCVEVMVAPGMPAPRAKRTAETSTFNAPTSMRCSILAETEGVTSRGRPKARWFAGVVDKFRAAGRIFGPTQFAAHSKAARRSPRISWRVTRFLPAITGVRRRRTRAGPCARSRRPDVIRPMAWPPARA